MIRLVFKALTKKRTRKPKRFSSKFLRWVCIPFTVLMVTLLAFFAFDDFIMQYWFLTSQQEAAEYRQNMLLSAGENWWASSSGVSSNADSLGGTGVANMLINKMQGGYYKEMLEIVRDHSDWSQMHSQVSPTIRNGEAIYPKVQQTLGTMLSEGGLENEGYTRVSPTTVLSGAHYSVTDGKHSLSTYNSEVCAADGGTTLSSGYNGNLDLYYGNDHTVRTSFQFTATYAAIYPSGRLTSQATFWPSKMNGYGIPEGTERTLADTDAAYFPDLLSIMLQRSWCRVINNDTFWDADLMTDTALNTAMYLPYNYGEAGFAYAWGLGMPYSRDTFKPFTYEGWSDSNTVSFRANTTYSVNYFDSVVEEALSRLSEGWDTYTAGVWDESAYQYWYGNHTDYKGFGTVSLLFNGCFVDTRNVSKVQAEAKDGGFIRGATVAYRLWTGKADATKEEVAAWFENDLPTKTIDESIYGNVVVSGDGGFVHYLDEDHPIYTDDGEGPYPALRSYGDGLRGPWMTRLGGIIIYWKMVQAAGVECTFEEAYQDSLGTLVSLAPEQSAEGDSSSSNTVSDEAEAVALQLARCMAAYSWPYRDAGMYNPGTELYQQVHDYIFPWDTIYMSCDRGVATAVHWSGADSSFPIGSTRNQIRYLDGSDGGTGDTRWTRIWWNGDISKLKPGDILIYSTPVRGTRPPSGNSVGHIVLYVGKDLIYQFHGDAAAKGSCICHASYHTRSPTCGTMYDDLYYFEAYRLTSPLPDESEVNAAPYP